MRLPSFVFSMLAIMLTIIYPNKSASQFTYGVSGYVNLLGNYQTFSDDPAEGTITNSIEGSCSGGISSVSPDCILKAMAYSNNCPPTSNSAATAKWKNNSCRLIGNNGISVPIDLNFSFSGEMALQTSPGPDCFNSIASGIFSYTLFHGIGTNIQESRGTTHIQMNNGFLSFYNSNGFDKEHSYARVVPKISLGVETKSLASEIDSLINKYRMLTQEEVDTNSLFLSEDYIALISGNVSLDVFEGAKDTISFFTGNFLNLLKYFNFDFGIELPGGVNLELGYDLDFQFDFTKTISVELADAPMLLDVYIQALASTIPICGPSSQVDFSNTVELKSASISEGFDTTGLNFSDLRLQLADGVEVPVVSDKTTSIRNHYFGPDNKILVYPNPFEDILIIQFDNIPRDPLKIDVVDIHGKILKSTYINKQLKTEISLLGLPKGVYFIKVHSDNFLITKRVLKAL